MAVLFCKQSPKGLVCGNVVFQGLLSGDLLLYNEAIEGAEIIPGAVYLWKFSESKFS